MPIYRFSARTGADWFWKSKPATILMVAASFSLTISTILACVWPNTNPDGIHAKGLLLEQPYSLPFVIWIYCIFWWFVQDAAKVCTYYFMKKYNVFGIDDTGVVVFGPSTIKYIKDHPPSVGVPGRH